MKKIDLISVLVALMLLPMFCGGQTFELKPLTLTKDVYLDEFDVIAKTTCSGSYTSVAAGCQAFQIGNGTSGNITICITNNSIPGGGGTSCNPGGACNPPYSGGGWAARIAIYGSNGSGPTGGALQTWTTATANGTCYTVSSGTGYAYIYGLCLTAGTTITWTTVNACGDQVCTGTPPPCASPTCTSCATACGSCGFVSSPTVPQVTSSCPDYSFSPSLCTGGTATRCHQFVANGPTVNFNVIVSSNCGGGNVSSFSWTLQSSTCGAILQSGNLSSLQFTGLTAGQTYTYCYTFTVPNPGPPTGSCCHTTHYPYFVNATTVLPVELLDFSGRVNQDYNELFWVTASEQNNDYFTVERSTDGKEYKELGRVKGAGNSSRAITYNYTDKAPAYGINYYRLKQTDFDGTSTRSKIIAIENKALHHFEVVSAYPNPANEIFNVEVNAAETSALVFRVTEMSGRNIAEFTRTVGQGINRIEIPVNQLAKGMYLLTIHNTESGKSEKLKFAVH